MIRMTQFELRQFALNYCDGQIFTSADVKDSDSLSMVFIPLIFLNELPADLGLVWEFYSAAGPRSINGYPAFYSMRMMQKDDLPLALDLIKTEQARRKAYLEGK